MISNPIIKRYINMPLSKVEGLAEKSCLASLKERRKFIEILFFFQQTKRYTQNKKYATYTFSQYIRDRYNLKMSDYREEKTAFIEFPDVAMKWGPGFVSRVRHRCGAINARKVFDEIKDKDTSLQGGVCSAKVETIIDKHVKIYTSAAATADSVSLGNQVEILKKNLREKELQISKLKATIKKIRGENRLLKSVSKKAA